MRARDDEAVRAVLAEVVQQRRRTRPRRRRRRSSNGVTIAVMIVPRPRHASASIAGGASDRPSCDDAGRGGAASRGGRRGALAGRRLRRLAAVTDEGEEVTLTGALAHVHEGEALEVGGACRRARQARPAVHAEASACGAGLEEALIAYLGRSSTSARAARAWLLERHGARCCRSSTATRTALLREAPGIGPRRIGAAVESWERRAACARSGCSSTATACRRRGRARLPRVRRGRRSSSCKPIRTRSPARGDRVRDGRRAGAGARRAARRPGAVGRRRHARAGAGRGRRALPSPARRAGGPRAAVAGDRRRRPDRRAGGARTAGDRRRGPRRRGTAGGDRAAPGGACPRAGPIGAGAGAS